MMKKLLQLTKLKYQSLVGKLISSSYETNLAYAVNVVSQFMYRLKAI